MMRRHLAGAQDQGLVEGGGAGAELTVDLAHQMGEGLADLGGALHGAFLEGAELALHGLAGFAGALGDGVGHRLALNRDDAVHFLQLAGDGLAEDGGVAGDAVGEDIAARNRLLERREAVVEHGVDGLRAAFRRVGEGGAALREGVADAGALGGHRQNDLAAGIGELAMRLFGMGGDEVGEATAMGAEGSLDILDPGGEFAADILGRAGDRARRLGGAADQGLVDLGQGAAQRFHRVLGAPTHLSAEAAGGLLEELGGFLCAGGELGRGGGQPLFEDLHCFDRAGFEFAGGARRGTPQGLGGFRRAGAEAHRGFFRAAAEDVGGLAGPRADLAGQGVEDGAQALDRGAGLGIEGAAENPEGSGQGEGRVLDTLGDETAHLLAGLGQAADAGIDDGGRILAAAAERGRCLGRPGVDLAVEARHGAPEVLHRAHGSGFEMGAEGRQDRIHRPRGLLGTLGDEIPHALPGGGQVALERAALDGEGFVQAVGHRIDALGQKTGAIVDPAAGGLDRPDEIVAQGRGPGRERFDDSLGCLGQTRLRLAGTGFDGLGYAAGRQLRSQREGPRPERRCRR